MSITATREVVEVEITATRNGETILLQPLLVKGGGDSNLFMLKSVYDPADKAEQVLTINSVIEGGTIT